MEPVKKKIQVLKAEYVKEAQSIAILGECSEGGVKTQIHKSSFDQNGRSDEEMDYEMEKLAHLMVGKNISLVFDGELEKKIECGQRLSYG